MRQRLVRGDAVLQVHQDKDGPFFLLHADDGYRHLPARSLDRDAVAAIEAALRHAEQGMRESEGEAGAVALLRVTLDVRDPELAGHAWEDTLAPAVAELGTACAIVRVSHVRPRVADHPFTLPLRMAIVDPLRGGLAAYVHHVFDRFPPGDKRAAFEAEELEIADVERFRERSQWPTAEVLHLGFGPHWREPESLSTAVPKQVATLGWLLRLTTTWQTRLVSFECDEKDLPAARRLAHDVVGKGGPAVLVGSRDRVDFGDFYDSLIHDRALDEAAVPRDAARPRPALLAGAGREEALRVSNVGVGLLALTKGLTIADNKELQRALENDVFKITGRGTVVSRDPVGVVREVLARDVADKWDGIDFRESERGGLLPVSDALRSVRKMTGSTPQAAQPAPVEGPRHVNSRLAVSGTDGRLERLEQDDARLEVGEVYQLAIQIGPRDETVKVFGAAALLEEHFQWGPDVKGRWLEVGVTALDFDLAGDPVQEVWLPKEGVSDEITFAIVAGRPGVLRLRFCVYVDQCLLQSFRLAAVAGEPERAAGVGLARALDVPVAEVGRAGYMTRLEYAAAASADSMLKSPARTLSVFANDLDGESVITIKGPGSFTVGTDTDLAQYVTGARSALERVALKAGSTEEAPEYAFDDATNAGDEAQMREALKTLAQSGWDLFGRIAPGKTAEVSAALEGKRGVIRIGHLLLKKVIPWALVYDRKYDSRRKEHKKKAVAHDACLAPLLPADQAPRKCKEHPQCLLHPDQVAAREAAGDPLLIDETVACPLHLWGFRHVIEVPPRHVTAGEQPLEQKDCITVEAPSRMSVATNEELALAASHRGALKSLCEDLGISAGMATASDRDAILDNLDDALVNLVYLYCHAIRGVAGGAGTIPQLVFPYADGSEGMISATDFEGGAKWETGPLVFLNGCRTAGFSPDALSPFVETLVKGRGAGGFLGTEVPVWEQVATDVALRFLRSFLKGVPAGLALLEARRSLLLESRNPLGLAYTLFGSADLALDLDGDGRCDKTPVET